MRCVVESAIFFGLASDQDVNPDAAVEQLEKMGTIMRGLNSAEVHRFSEFVNEMAASERRELGETQRVSFMMWLIDDFGLSDMQPSP